MTLPVPTEDSEQRAFVAWLRLHDIPHWRTPNETYTKSWAQKNKNKALGVSAGIPDLFVVLEGVGLVGIEMKRQRGGVVSPAQKEWITILNKLPNVEVHVTKGCDEAIAVIESYLPQLKRKQTGRIF